MGTKYDFVITYVDPTRGIVLEKDCMVQSEIKWGFPYKQPTIYYILKLPEYWDYIHYRIESSATGITGTGKNGLTYYLTEITSYRKEKAHHADVLKEMLLA